MEDGQTHLTSIKNNPTSPVFQSLIEFSNIEETDETKLSPDIAELIRNALVRRSGEENITAEQILGGMTNREVLYEGERVPLWFLVFSWVLNPHSVDLDQLKPFFHNQYESMSKAFTCSDMFSVLKMKKEELEERKIRHSLKLSSQISRALRTGVLSPESLRNQVEKDMNYEQKAMLFLASFMTYKTANTILRMAMNDPEMKNINKSKYWSKIKNFLTLLKTLTPKELVETDVGVDYLYSFYEGKHVAMLCVENYHEDPLVSVMQYQNEDVNVYGGFENGEKYYLPIPVINYPAFKIDKKTLTNLLRYSEELKQTLVGYSLLGGDNYIGLEDNDDPIINIISVNNYASKGLTSKEAKNMLLALAKDYKKIVNKIIYSKSFQSVKKTVAFKTLINLLEAFNKYLSYLYSGGAKEKNKELIVAITITTPQEAVENFLKGENRELIGLAVKKLVDYAGSQVKRNQNTGKTEHAYHTEAEEKTGEKETYTTITTPIILTKHGKNSFSYDGYAETSPSSRKHASVESNSNYEFIINWITQTITDNIEEISRKILEKHWKRHVFTKNPDTGDNAYNPSNKDMQKTNKLIEMLVELMTTPTSSLLTNNETILSENMKNSNEKSVLSNETEKTEKHENKQTLMQQIIMYSVADLMLKTSRKKVFNKKAKNNNQPFPDKSGNTTTSNNEVVLSSSNKATELLELLIELLVREYPLTMRDVEKTLSGLFGFDLPSKKETNEKGLGKKETIEDRQPRMIKETIEKLKALLRKESNTKKLETNLYNYGKSIIQELYMVISRVGATMTVIDLYPSTNITKLSNKGILLLEVPWEYLATSHVDIEQNYDQIIDGKARIEVFGNHPQLAITTKQIIWEVTKTIKENIQETLTTVITEMLEDYSAKANLRNTQTIKQQTKTNTRHNEHIPVNRGGTQKTENLIDPVIDTTMLLAKLLTEIRPKNANNKKLLPVLANEKIRDNTKYMPPCIKQLHRKLVTTGTLDNRDQHLVMTLYFKKIGYSPEEVLKYWYENVKRNKEKGISYEEFVEGEIGYQVQHLYGLRGGMIDYTAYSCDTMQTFGLCPLKTSNTQNSNKKRFENVQKILMEYAEEQLPDKNKKEIEQLARKWAFEVVSRTSNTQQTCFLISKTVSEGIEKEKTNKHKNKKPSAKEDDSVKKAPRRSDKEKVKAVYTPVGFTIQATTLSHDQQSQIQNKEKQTIREEQTNENPFV